MKAVAGLIVALLLVGAAAWLLHSAPGPLDAHTFSQAGATDFLWPDLEPGGDGHITFWMCPTSFPSQWLDGMVNWDWRLPAWSFDPQADPDCVPPLTAQTIFNWEGTSGWCPPVDPVTGLPIAGCWQMSGFDFPIGGGHGHIYHAQILFDWDEFRLRPYSYAWKTAVSAHEWGHNMDLADHWEASQAVAGTLMNSAIEDPPTYQGPTPDDLQSVLCAAYLRCDLWGIKKSSTGTGKTEAHVQSNDSGAGAWRFIHQAGTALGETGSNWQFGVGDWNGDGRPDLWGIKKSATGTGKTEVHIQSYNASTNTWQFVLQKGTALHETGSNWDFAVGDWNLDGRPDLWGIKKWGTGTGTTELHIQSYNTSTNTWQFVLHQGTALSQTGSNWKFAVGDWNWDVRPELWGIKKWGTGTGTTEVHMQSYNTGTGNWQFVLQKGTALHETGSNWDFAVAAWNRDRLDLWGIKKSGTGSGKTELHIQSYNTFTNTWQFALQQATALSETGSNWEFAAIAWD